MTPIRHALACAVLLLLAGQAGAMAVAGPGGTAGPAGQNGAAGPGRGMAQPAPPAAPAVSARATAPTLDLVAARIDTVDLAAGSITVRRQAVPLHPTDLRVLGARGQLLNARSLRAGQTVRLALEPAATAPASDKTTTASKPASATTAMPAAPAARRIVLIYIDA